MAARSDRTLRTTCEVVVGQCRVLSQEDISMHPLARARVVVLLDDLLQVIENPTTSRAQRWTHLLENRDLVRNENRVRPLDELTRELAENNSPAVLQRLAAARAATLQASVEGPLPMSVNTQFGQSLTVDYLRATLVELAVIADSSGRGTLQPAALRMCVRLLSQALGERFAGQTIEVRIPPASAVQVGAFGEGPRHTRGTPPNVVETDELTWLRLATGLTTLDEALDQARATASGTHYRALERMLPVVPLQHIAG